MAQPAVSTRIRNLETELGQVLFRRGRRGVQLTAAGERFLAYVQRSLELLEAGRGAVAVADRRPLQIGLSIWAQTFILPLIDRYVREEKGWVSVTLGRAHDLAAWLLDGKVDVAFMVPVPLQSGLRAQPIVRGSVVCAAAPDHPLRERGPLRLVDLLTQPLALSHWGDGYEDLISHLQRAGSGSQVALVLPSMARALAAESGYVAIVPDALIADDLATGRLAVLPVEDFAPVPWRIDAVFRERKRSAPELTAFLRRVLPPGAKGYPPEA